MALDPDNVQAHLELAALASAGGAPGGAVQELREVLRIDPQHLAAHVALTTLYGSLGDSRAAAMHQAYGARIRAER